MDTLHKRVGVGVKSSKILKNFLFINSEPDIVREPSHKATGIYKSAWTKLIKVWLPWQWNAVGKLF